MNIVNLYSTVQQHYQVWRRYEHPCFSYGADCNWAVWGLSTLAFDHLTLT